MNCTDQVPVSTWDLTEKGAFAASLSVVAAPRAWNDGEDPNGPWLPRVPGPRRAPAQVYVLGHRLVAEDDKPQIPGQRIPAKVPEQPIRNHGYATSHTCCGREMTREGQQYVCSKCGSWRDPGVVPAAAGIAMAGRS